MNSSICEAPFVSNWCPSITPSNTQLTHFRIRRYNSSFSFVKCLSSKSSSSSSALAAVASTQDELQQSFLASYLIDSCGVSAQRAVYASRIYANKLRSDTPEKPDSMLAFLRNNGFTDDDIAMSISYDPMLLSYSEETLLPKIQFFYSIGFTQRDLPFFLAKSGLSRHSLNDYIIPLYSMLKDVLETEREIIVCFEASQLCSVEDELQAHSTKSCSFERSWSSSLQISIVSENVSHGLASPPRRVSRNR